MKKFNEHPNDKYPTFSLCFKGEKFHWYRDANIFKTYSLNASQYTKMLRGENALMNKFDIEARLYDKEPVFVNDSLDANFETFHIQSTDFLLELQFMAEKSDNDIHISHVMQSNASFEPHMILSYQTPDTICFARNENDLLNNVRKYDSITFNSSFLGNHMFNETEIQIFIHYPGQLMRSFDKPKYTASFPYFLSTLKGIEKNRPNILEFKISQGRTLRKRPNSNPPCNKDISSFDQHLQQKLIDRLECIPTYWKNIQRSHSKYVECQSPIILKYAYNNISEVKNILEWNEQPCDEMILLSIDSINNNPTIIPKDITIEFIYTEKIYEEIEFTQAIGFENWLSNVGGFVGIFLGYSMMQFPEALSFIFEFFSKQKYKNLVRKYLNLNKLDKELF